MFLVTENSLILRKQSIHYHADNNTPLDFILNQANQSTLSTLMLCVYLHLLLSSYLHFSDNQNIFFFCVFLMSPVHKGYVTAKFTILILTRTKISDSFNPYPTMGTGSLPGVKRPGRGADHPPPSKCRGQERVGLYLYSTSGPLWPVMGAPP